MYLTHKCHATQQQQQHEQHATQLQQQDKHNAAMQALNQDRAASPFPNRSEASLWDQIHLLSDLTEEAGQLEASTSTETQAAEQFWEYNPAGSTKCWDGRCRVS